MQDPSNTACTHRPSWQPILQQRHPRLQLEILENISFYHEGLAVNPCHHHGPNCHWPHCPQVPLGGLRHGSQGGKAKPHVVDGLWRGQVGQVHQVR
ncbi:hypothetical protein NMG60_11029280 [Bertholletia excelsa]